MQNPTLRRPPGGLTKEQAAVWTVVHMAFDATWLSLDLANRLLGQTRAINRIVTRLVKTKPSGRRQTLTREQLAVGELLLAAIGEYSESNWCASWLCDIEHSLWDEVILRPEDPYEKACARLYKLAGKTGWRRPRKRSLFVEGLNLLSEQYGVWVCYETKRGRTILPLAKWLPRHALGQQQELQRRPSYDQVWESAHFEFDPKKRKPVPPLPKLKLPPIQPA